MPVEIPDDQPSRNRSNRRSHSKKDGDLAHDPLRLGQGKYVAHHGARNHNARPGGKTLQGAKKNQLSDILRQGASGGGSDKDGQPRQNHRPAAETVGQRAMEQIHEGEAEQIGRQGLLHLDGRGLQRIANGGECRDVGIDGERAQHAQHGQQDGQGPQGRFPETLGIDGVHQKEKSFRVRTGGQAVNNLCPNTSRRPVFNVGIVRVTWRDDRMDGTNKFCPT